MTKANFMLWIQNWGNEAFQNVNAHHFLLFQDMIFFSSNEMESTMNFFSLMHTAFVRLNLSIWIYKIYEIFLTLTVGLLCQHVHEFFKKKRILCILASVLILAFVYCLTYIMRIKNEKCPSCMLWLESSYGFAMH